ncbi:putative lipoprotein, partial [Vibrio parahaemolyticus EKP-028]
SIHRKFLFLVEYAHDSDNVAFDPIGDDHRNLRNYK